MYVLEFLRVSGVSEGFRGLEGIRRFWRVLMSCLGFWRVQRVSEDLWSFGVFWEVLGKFPTKNPTLGGHIISHILFHDPIMLPNPRKYL